MILGMNAIAIVDEHHGFILMYIFINGYLPVINERRHEHEL